MESEHLITMIIPWNAWSSMIWWNQYYIYSKN